MNALPNEQAGIAPLDWHHLFRSRVEHEDNLIVQRLSWLVASQAFLFTAYAISTNGLSSALPQGETRFLHQLEVLFRLIPLVAVLNALLIFMSILAAIQAIRQLAKSYEAGAGASALPALRSPAIIRRLGLSAPILLPLLFIGVWLFLFFHGLG